LTLKNTTIDKTLTDASETGTLTERETERKLNIFEGKVYRRILGPVYDNEKENGRMLTDTEIYRRVKKTCYNRERVRLNRLCWFGHEQRMEDNRIPKNRIRSRNRWQDEVREDG
jgi:hypothetical protein